MQSGLALLDLAIIGLYFLFALAVGWFFSRRAGSSLESFFVGDRRLPWWLAGTSIVATTFAADTPLAVTGIVATHGISGNWIWWCWAIAHLTATFFFARLWRRSGVITDAEIVELRYSGRPAAALRGFKAVYFGLFINCLTMAWVIAAMVKISRAFFDVEPGWVIVASMSTAVAYTVLGGFRSVVVTDVVQFLLGMGGAVLIAILLVRGFGGLGALPVDDRPGRGLLGELATSVAATGEGTIAEVVSFLPPRDHPTIPWVFLVVLLIAGWWRFAEGQGYIVQRLAACRNEAHAQAASLWFAVAHNALRPWPWILVGLASLVVYPRLAGDSPGEPVSFRLPGRPAAVRVMSAQLDVAIGGTLQFDSEGPVEECTAIVAGQEVAIGTTRGLPGAGRPTARFGRFEESGFFQLALDCGAGPANTGVDIRVELIDREMAYPLLMGRTLPSGLLGLAIASLIAAFMSTIDTHTNWGASYLVRDLYQRFLRPRASPEHYVLMSRLAIVLIAVLAGVTALFIHNIAAVWRFVISLGAGLGSVTAVRWYWPRVTAYAEFAAIGVTTVLAVGLELFGTSTLFGGPNPFFVVAVPAWAKIIGIAVASLATWVPVALLGPRTEEATLRRFAAKVRPPGPGWARYRKNGENSEARPGTTRAEERLLPLVGRFGAGAVVVFGSLFGLGDLMLGRPIRGLALLLAALICLAAIVSSGTRGEAKASR